MKLKRYIILTACILLTVFGLASCKKAEETQPAAEYCTVSFDTWGGSEVAAIRVLKGGTANAPADPQKDGCIFNGWEYKGTDWVFSTDKVNEDMTLKAKWVDAENVYAVEGDMDTGKTVTGIKKEYANMAVPAKIGGIEVVAIGEGVFANISDTVESITIAETVKSVGKEAFKEVTVPVTFKGELTSVGESAFFGCTGLTSVKFGEGLTSVAPSAFFGCTGLTELVLPESLVLIDENAFEDCTSVKAIIMHSETKTICDGAFFNMKSLEVIYMYGAQTDVDGMEIAVMNSEFEDVLESNVYFYSAEKPAAKGKYWYFSDNGKIRIWEEK